MTWKIPLSDIDITQKEIDSVTQVLRSRWLSLGPVSERFETAFAEYLGVKHAFGVSNGTAALHIAHRAIAIGIGDEVITPSLTFVATANSILYCGGRPVFADIEDYQNFNISPENIMEKISSKTRAITLVHYAGYSCNMKAIMDIAHDNSLRVIEDAAHAVGSEYDGKKCGTIGDIGCFSFFANKNLVTGEGGMIVTNDDRIADKIRLLRSHGMTTLTWDRHKGHATSYDVIELGYNYRLNEMASALGIVQLEKLNEHNRRREELDKIYRAQLKNISYLSCPFASHPWRSAHHIFPILLNEGVSREKVMSGLKINGIQTSIHYRPIHTFTLYKQQYHRAFSNLGKTEYVGNHEVTLPIYPTMTDDDVGYIASSLRELGDSIDTQ